MKPDIWKQLLEIFKMAITWSSPEEEKAKEEELKYYVDKGRFKDGTLTKDEREIVGDVYKGYKNKRDGLFNGDDQATLDDTEANKQKMKKFVDKLTKDEDKNNGGGRSRGGNSNRGSNGRSRDRGDDDDFSGGHRAPDA